MGALLLFLFVVSVLFVPPFCWGEYSAPLEENGAADFEMGNVPPKEELHAINANGEQISILVEGDLSVRAGSLNESYAQGENGPADVDIGTLPNVPSNVPSNVINENPINEEELNATTINGEQIAIVTGDGQLDITRYSSQATSSSQESATGSLNEPYAEDAIHTRYTRMETVDMASTSYNVQCRTTRLMNTHWTSFDAIHIRHRIFESALLMGLRVQSMERGTTQLMNRNATLIEGNVSRREIGRLPTFLPMFPREVGSHTAATVGEQDQLDISHGSSPEASSSQESDFLAMARSLNELDYMDSFHSSRRTNETVLEMAPLLQNQERSTNVASTEESSPENAANVDKTRWSHTWLAPVAYGGMTGGFGTFIPTNDNVLHDMYILFALASFLSSLSGPAMHLFLSYMPPSYIQPTNRIVNCLTTAAVVFLVIAAALAAWILIHGP